MVYENKPDDLHRSPDDPDRSNLSHEDVRRQARLDDDLPMDPGVDDDPAIGVRIAMFAIAVAVVFGAVFYALNISSINPAATSSTARNTQSSPPTAPPGMRDVIPRANTDQGVTTGAAPARPQMPPATAPAEMSRSGKPPASNAPGK